MRGRHGAVNGAGQASGFRGIDGAPKHGPDDAKSS